jgi:hypothetical protein
MGSPAPAIGPGAPLMAHKAVAQGEVAHAALDSTVSAKTLTTSKARTAMAMSSLLPAGLP